MPDFPPEKEEIVLKKRRIFGRNLRAARREAGITQEDLVKKTGFTQTFISLVETAKCGVSLDAATLLADAVSQPLCKLLTPRD